MNNRQPGAPDTCVQVSSCRATCCLICSGLPASAQDAISAGNIVLWSTVLSKISAQGACLWGLGEVARDLSGGLAGPSGSCSSSSAIPLILGTPAGVACSLVSSSPAGKLFRDGNPRRKWSASTFGTLSCACYPCFCCYTCLTCCTMLGSLATHAWLCAKVVAKLVATCQYIANATNV